MFSHTNLSHSAYRNFLLKYGGDEVLAFTSFVKPIINRFCKQTNRPLLSDEIIENYCRVLWEVSEEHGFPKPLEKGDKGEAHDIDPDDLSEIMACVLDRIEYPEVRMDLAILSNQFLKAILQPEFKSCRLSYCKQSDHEVCERQNLKHCKRRIGGSHCVDCPLFIATRPEKHPKVLKSQWNHVNQEELDENLEVFLPSDFRQLKYFLHLHRRAYYKTGDTKWGGTNPGA